MRSARANSAARIAVVVVALAATGLIGLAIKEKRWLVADSETASFSLGLVGAEMCLEGGCRAAPSSAFGEASDTSKLGMAVMFSAVGAALLLLLAVARNLLGGERGRWLGALAVGAGLFSGSLAAIWLALSPFGEGMAPGRSAIVFYVGIAFIVATAVVPLGAFRRTPGNRQ